VAKSFAVWKTIKIGTGHLRSGHDFIAAITEKGMEVRHFAELTILSSQFKIAEKEAMVNLVAISVLDLGFDKVDSSRGIKGGTGRQIYARAKELGLQLCPAEVGPQLRLQYPEQSGREWLVVAMNAIIDPFNLPWLFRVEHDIEQGQNIRSLCTFCGRLESFWPEDFRFVFVLPGTF
jgi:hypothetical protein